MELTEKTILQHEHEIDNAFRMYNNGSISYDCYMESKARHGKAIKELLEAQA